MMLHQIITLHDQPMLWVAICLACLSLMAPAVQWRLALCGFQSNGFESQATKACMDSPARPTWVTVWMRWPSSGSLASVVPCGYTCILGFGVGVEFLVARRACRVTWGCRAA